LCSRSCKRPKPSQFQPHEVYEYTNQLSSIRRHRCASFCPSSHILHPSTPHRQLRDSSKPPCPPLQSNAPSRQEVCLDKPTLATHTRHRNKQYIQLMERGQAAEHHPWKAAQLVVVKTPGCANKWLCGRRLLSSAPSSCKIYIPTHTSMHVSRPLRNAYSLRVANHLTGPSQMPHSRPSHHNPNPTNNATPPPHSADPANDIDAPVSSRMHHNTPIANTAIQRSLHPRHRSHRKTTTHPPDKQ